MIPVMKRSICFWICNEYLQLEQQLACPNPQEQENVLCFSVSTLFCCLLEAAAYVGAGTDMGPSPPS